MRGGVGERGNVLCLHCLRVAKSARPSRWSLVAIFDRLLITFVSHATQLLHIIAVNHGRHSSIFPGDGEKL